MKNSITSFGTILIAALSFYSVPMAANYTVGVDASKKGAAWSRFYEGGVACDHMITVLKTNPAYAGGRGCKRALQIAHDSAGIQFVRGHGILNDDIGVYVGPGNYNWTNLDRVYDSIKAAGMRPIVEISFMPGALATAKTCVTGIWYNNVCGYSCAPNNWTNWENLIKALIAHLEERYGVEEVRKWYFELWNEVSWMYACGGGETGYLTLYDHTAAAFKAQDSLCKLGGPAGSADNMYFIPTFINHCKTNKVKLDFVTWHAYGDNGPTNSPSNNATNFYNYHKTAVQNCNSAGFSGPIICTEFANSYKQLVSCHDNEMAASFVAKVVYLMQANASSLRLPLGIAWWTVSDLYEENDNTKSNPAFAGVFGLLTKGVAGNIESWDIPKPAFNAFKLLHKLNAFSLPLTVAAGNVNGVSTISATNDTVSVLLFNQVDDETGNSSNFDNVTLNITGIPNTQMTATVRHWVVDKTHSNAYQAWVSAGKPSSPSTAQWSTIAKAGQLQTYDTIGSVTLGGTSGAGTFSKTFPQYTYSVGLIQLTNFTTTSILKVSKSRLFTIDKFKAEVTGKNLLVSMPGTDKYSMALYATSGKKVMRIKNMVAGSNVLSLAHVSSGTYLIECTGSKDQRFTKTIVVGR